MHVNCKNYVLNSIVLKENILGVVVLIHLLSSCCQVSLLCSCEVYLREAKVNDSIEYPFK
jgi:hypothetical protein